MFLFRKKRTTYTQIHTDFEYMRVYIVCDQKARIEDILKHHDLVNISTPHRAQLLYYAAHHIDILALLCNHGWDINAEARDGLTPLHLAVLYGSSDSVKNILAFHPDVNKRGALGNTPLFWAAGMMDDTAIEILLKHGAKIGIREAALMGNTSEIQELISAGANIHSVGVGWRTPLHLAAIHGHRVTVATLLALGTDIDVTDSYGRTPLFWAAMAEKYTFCCDDPFVFYHERYPWKTYSGWEQKREEASNAATVAYLLEKGANPSGIGDRTAFARVETTALEVAIQFDNPQITRILLAHKAPISEDRLPLSLAAKYGSTKTLEMLIELGADINGKDRQGCTALSYAVAAAVNAEDVPRPCYLEIVRRLLSLGVNVRVPGVDGRALLELPALCTLSEHSIKNIYARDNNQPTVDIASNLSLVNLLRQAGAEIHLVEAAILNDEKCLLQALKQGEAIEQEVRGMTALQYAAERNNVAAVRVLVEHGANVNRVERFGWTPLLRVSNRGYTEIVGLLIAGGTDIHAKTDSGSTALREAKFHRHKAIVRLLKRAGARK